MFQILFSTLAYILNGKQFMGSPWEMYLMNGYLARTKTGYMYGYGSNICLFPELKLGEFYADKTL